MTTKERRASILIQLTNEHECVSIETKEKYRSNRKDVFSVGPVILLKPSKTHFGDFQWKIC